MTRNRALAALVLVPLLAVALASCGDDDERLSKPEFTKELNALCKERDKKTEPLLDEQNFFNMKIGQKVWPKAKTVIDDYIDGVSDLEPPEDAEELIDSYLDDADAVAANVDDVIDAANDEDQKVYSQQLNSLFNKFGSIDKEIGAYGAGDCFDEDEQFPESEEPAAGAAVVEIGATEYAFEIPSGIKAGKTAFKLVNKGEELHLLGYGRLKEGATFEQLKQAISSGEEDPGLLEEEGLTGIASPDGSITANTELSAGTYVAYCFLPAPDGEEHLKKGMLASFAVS